MQKRSNEQKKCSNGLNKLSIMLKRQFILITQAISLLKKANSFVVHLTESSVICREEVNKKKKEDKFDFDLLLFWLSFEK